MTKRDTQKTVTSKKSFIIHNDYKKLVDKLPDEQAGQLFKAIFYWQENNELPDLEFAVDVAITPLISQFERDLEKYENICNRNKENGKRGGRPKNQSEPNKPSGLSGNPNKPKKADSDSDSDSENDSENDKKETKKAIALRVSNFFNSNRGSMPECKMMTDKRIKTINARISDYGESAVCELITKATESDFLQGKTDAGFKCGIDWIMNPSNYVKIAEGNYENKANHSTSSPHLHVSSSRNPEDYQL